MSRAKQKKKREEKKKHARRMSQGGRSGGGGGGMFMGVGKKTIRTAPIRDVYISPLIFKEGMGPVVISRDLPNGEIAMGVFLVDAYCLGIKNAFLTLCSTFKYTESIEKMRENSALEPSTASYARKMVEEAVEYAHNLGFKPQRDYRDAKIIMGDIVSDASLKEFAFGKDGKPFYISGPDDSQQEISRILNTLEIRCGMDGFTYMLRQDIF